MTKPVPLRLCGRDLPWVESATHLGHEDNPSGIVEHIIAKIARFIDQSVEVHQEFSFASQEEIIRALQVYCSSSGTCKEWGQLSNSIHGQLQSSWLGTALWLQDLILFRKSLPVVAPVQKQISWLGSASSFNPIRGLHSGRWLSWVRISD